MANLGKYIIAAGILVVLIGLVVFFFGNKPHWLGPLPGDIRIKKENVRFYFPLTTMLLLSVLLTVLLRLLKRFR